MNIFPTMINLIKVYFFKRQLAEKFFLHPSRGSKLIRSDYKLKPRQLRVSFDRYLKYVDVRSFCMPYISMYPCGACMRVCGYICFLRVKRAYAFSVCRKKKKKKTCGRDSARFSQFCVCRRFCSIARCTTGFLCSMISNRSRHFKKKKEKKKKAPRNNSVTPDDMSHTYRMNSPDICIDSCI